MIQTGVRALIKVKRLTESAKLPERGTEGSAGLDIFADENVSINPGETIKIHTGIAVEIPPGCVGLFLDKSSFGITGVHNYAGVIDSDYRGELMVVLHNSTSVGKVYVAGQKITQLVVVPFISLHPYEVQELSDTQRGNGAFGSTGAF
jgi:dUTP pyrophosphatase